MVYGIKINATWELKSGHSVKIYIMQKQKSIKYYYEN